jgi:hypothetical protein
MQQVDLQILMGEYVVINDNDFFNNDLVLFIEFNDQNAFYLSYIEPFNNFVIPEDPYSNLGFEAKVEGIFKTPEFVDPDRAYDGSGTFTGEFIGINSEEQLISLLNERTEITLEGSASFEGVVTRVPVPLPFTAPGSIVGIAMLWRARSKAKQLK